ncbi:MAG TPA: hypothetical protein ENJ37_06040 [Deltaproteobacteria bacterium]|nr:hypothetical protein [Deltaproteobacteria bacterium]
MKSSTARSALAVILAAALWGCANPVEYTIVEHYGALAPASVAVLPVEWGHAVRERNPAAAVLFREVTIQKLRSMSYAAAAADETDAAIAAYGRSRFDELDPAGKCRLLGTEAFMRVVIDEWDKSMLAIYGSLTLRTSFELYSKDGGLLWSASYETKEWDLTFDRETMEIAILGTFEPRVQRIVDMAFTTLLERKEHKPERTYFEWLR